MKTYYVTKYALTQGIWKVQGEASEGRSGMLCFQMAGGLNNKDFAHGNDWHETLEAAQDRAEEMRQKKIASIAKQRKRLDGMSIAVVEIR